jgi:hypothetical protein
MQSAPLRADARLFVDLTLPPRPPAEHIVLGREGGQFQLLAKMEREGDRHFVVLTPHLYRPRINDFSQRTLLERELDGRVYSELSVRIELKPDRLIAVGLYWPWPEQEPMVPLEQDPSDATEPTTEAVSDTRNDEEIVDLDAVLTSSEVPLDDDPAAPPSRIRNPGAAEPAPIPRGTEPDVAINPDIVAPELPMHLGRVLLTGTRARKPVQTMLLISIPAPAEATDEAPADPADDAASPDAPDAPDSESAPQIAE